MREIYTSPRPENIDLVVAMLASHGIETKVTNRVVYDHPSYKRFSYGPRENPSRWPRVEVRYAKDMSRARALLRTAGVEPLGGFTGEIDFARQLPRKRSAMYTARRIRTILLAVLVAVIVILFLKMSGVA